MSEDQALRSRKPGRSFLRINIKTMMILVATSSLVIWSARRVWEDSTQSPYIRVLQFGNTADRRIAARQLLATTRPAEAQKVVGALILALRDEDAEVRAAAANSLGSVVRGLLDGWKTSPDELRTNQPLVSTTSRALIGLLSDAEDTVKSEALSALVVIHFRSISPTINAMPKRFCLGLDPSDKHLTRDLRTSVVTSLSDQTSEIRGLAAWTLGSLGPFLSHDIPPELVNAMNDPVEEVRQGAASACSEYEEGLSPLLPTLFARLEQAKPPFRQVLRNCLVRGKADPSLVPLLREGLRSSSPYVRECAASLLARMGQKAAAAIPELMTVLNEPFKEEQPKRFWPNDQPDPARYAARALSNFPPTPAYLDALVRGLQSDAPDRRRLSTTYLGEIGPAARTTIPALISALRAHLKGNKSDAGDISYALGKIAPGTEYADISIAVLVDALQSNDEYTRWQAATAIGRFGPKAKIAIPLLQGLTRAPMAGDRWNLDIREAARKALQAIEPASASPVSSHKS